MTSWSNFVGGGFAGPICLAITVVGVVLSAIAWRKKGMRSGIRGIAWSLLPLAAWLTHSLLLVGRIVSAIVQFAGAFVFSPKAWLGVILVGISALLFLTSGGIPLFQRGKRSKKAKEAKSRGSDQSARGDQSPAAVSPARHQPPARAGDDDDMREIQDILRKRGIS